MSALLKIRFPVSDETSMIGRMLRRYLSSIAPSAAMLWLAVTAAFCPAAMAAAPGTPEGGDDDVPPDFNYIRGKAEAGSAKAQTLLGDFYMAGSDFTNAVVWYRKAAEQGDVGAQLTLASCLITGRGNAKNPQEAAKWLREAARLIESPKALPQPAAAPASNDSAPTAARAIVITKETVAASSTNSSAADNAALSPPTPPAATNLSRVQRVDALHAVEPVLQEARPALKPYSDSR
jgi:TPR repeat protein